MTWTTWNIFVRIAITKSIRQSLTIVIGLTVTENYYRQKEKSGGPLPPGGLILDTPIRTEGDTSKKLRRVARI